MTGPAKRLMTELDEGYEDVVRGMARMTKHLGADADAAVASAAKAFVHAAADLRENQKALGESLAKKAGEEVSEHPVATAAIAAAAVGLLGFAITHTRKSRH